MDAHVPQRARLGGVAVAAARANTKKKSAPRKKAAARPAKKAAPRVPQRTPKGAAAELALSQFALGFPGAVEEFPWGHRVAKVGKKIFVTFGNDERAFSMSAKLPRSAQIALTLPFAEPTGYGLGKSGWVTARFAVNETPPLDMMRAWIEESYRAIAPAKLIKALST